MFYSVQLNQFKFETLKVNKGIGDLACQKCPDFVVITPRKFRVAFFQTVIISWP